jgi:hypothetical protein
LLNEEGMIAPLRRLRSRLTSVDSSEVDNVTLAASCTSDCEQLGRFSVGLKTERGVIPGHSETAVFAAARRIEGTEFPTFNRSIEFIANQPADRF